MPLEVRPFALDVESLAEDFPERGQRKCRWFSPLKAAQLVAEPGLKHILGQLEVLDPDCSLRSRDVGTSRLPKPGASRSLLIQEGWYRTA